MATQHNLILPLKSREAELAIAGGKGVNLSRLYRAGFRVPAGFIVTTAAYQEFVEKNVLVEKIDQLLRSADLGDNKGLQEISIQIRNQFDQCQIPHHIQEEVFAAYDRLENESVAVRSSATAEDLPGISFAGQQDTFLNINTEETLIAALISSWSSLWTARAISYRERYKIPHQEVSMAIIVQEMVPCFCSGVLFTANPLTGSRFETVINATYGLGELLVSGQVEPDQYTIDTQSGKILEKKIGSQNQAMYLKDNGEFNMLDLEARDKPVLDDEQVKELTEIGAQIADLFQDPQDIEWGISGNQVYILQSRPITTLYPLPEQPSAKPLKVYFSFAAIQGILDPMTPLGQDAISWLFAGGASLLEFDFDHQTFPLIKNAGERLWIDLTNALRNPLGRRIMRRFITIVDPGAAQVLNSLLENPRVIFGTGNLRLSTLRRMGRFMSPLLKQAYDYIRFPEGAAEKIQQASQAEIARIREKYPHPIRLTNLVDLFLEIREGFIYAVPEIAAGAAGGIIPLFLLNKLCQHLTGSNQLALEITRGIPNNVTTQMDLELWYITRTIRSDKTSLEFITQANASQLSEGYLCRSLPEFIQELFDDFLDMYGARGLGEIDLGRKRWQEDPTQIFEIVKGYLQIEDPDLAPDKVFQEGKRAAEDAVKELQSIARRTFAGERKANLVGYLAVRVRALAGLRESPKFYIIQLMGIIRQGLLECGQQLMAEGKLERVEDIFYLSYNELVLVTENADLDLATIVEQRRELSEIESLRKRIPRLLLSDGRAFYEGVTPLESQSGALTGSPVSPGVVEGKIRVVMDPVNPGLKPGEIMVCQGTDPAWTPLFLTAGGLIMEVGGIMTHGAIVAREYGIPAVVGVSHATEALQSGQRVQLNGSTGEILILESDNGSG